MTTREGMSTSAIKTLSTDLNLPGHLIGLNIISYGDGDDQRICEISKSDKTVHCNLKKSDIILDANNNLDPEFMNNRYYNDKTKGLFLAHIFPKSDFLSNAEYQDAYHIWQGDNTCWSDPSGVFRCDNDNPDPEFFTISKQGDDNNFNYTIQNADTNEHLYVDVNNNYKIKTGTQTPSTFKITSYQYGHTATHEPVDECLGWCPFDADETAG